MPNTFAIAGASAELRWGYYKAATLSAWAVANTDGVWTVTATVRDVDDFKVSQRPLMIVTPNGWKWPVATLSIAGETLTASLRLQELSNESVRETADSPPAA